MNATAAAPVVLGTAKITVRALLPRVFEALVTSGDVKLWWSPEAYIEPQVGGRYETNPPEGRQEGAIVTLDAPWRLTFTWTIVEDSSSIETTVTYDLEAKGEETVVQVIHRATSLLAKDWNATWRRALESLQAFLEAGQGTKGP